MRDERRWRLCPGNRAEGEDTERDERDDGSRVQLSHGSPLPDGASLRIHSTVDHKRALTAPEALRAGAFEPSDHGEPELRGARAVDDSVVERHSDD